MQNESTKNQSVKYSVRNCIGQITWFKRSELGGESS